MTIDERRKRAIKWLEDIYQDCLGGTQRKFRRKTSLL